jgi:hypothetical protein
MSISISYCHLIFKKYWRHFWQYFRGHSRIAVVTVLRLTNSVARLSRYLLKTLLIFSRTHPSVLTSGLFSSFFPRYVLSVFLPVTLHAVVVSPCLSKLQNLTAECHYALSLAPITSCLLHLNTLFLVFMCIGPHIQPAMFVKKASKVMEG